MAAQDRPAITARRLEHIKALLIKKGVSPTDPTLGECLSYYAEDQPE